MPRNTLYNDKFAALVNEAVAGLSNDRAGKLAGLSPETIRRMRSGRIPDVSTLDKFCSGISAAESKRHELMFAAGYEQAKDFVERIGETLRYEDRLSEANKEAILRFARRVQEREENRRKSAGQS